MATTSNPISTWVASILTLANGGLNQSLAITVTINVTSGWEVQIPIQIRYSNVSSDALVNIYPSMDGGVTYDSVAMASFSIAQAAGKTQQASIRLTTGQYVLSLINSGPYSASFAVLTQLVITAVQNV